VALPQNVESGDGDAQRELRWLNDPYLVPGERKRPAQFAQLD